VASFSLSLFAELRATSRRELRCSLPEALGCQSHGEAWPYAGSDSGGEVGKEGVGFRDEQGQDDRDHWSFWNEHLFLSDSLEHFSDEFSLSWERR
jgi:hypothetical protein